MEVEKTVKLIPLVHSELNKTKATEYYESVFKNSTKKTKKWFCNQPLSPNYTCIEKFISNGQTKNEVLVSEQEKVGAENCFSGNSDIEQERDAENYLSDNSDIDPDYIEESDYSDNSVGSLHSDTHGEEKEIEDEMEEIIIPIQNSVVANINQERSKRQRDFCFFCEDYILNFARHIQRNHSCETEVQKILALPIKSKVRKQLYATLRKKGNYLVNSQTLKKPMKKSALNPNFLPCTYCLGFYSAKQLWRHRKVCTENVGNNRLRQTDCQNRLLAHIKIDAQLREQVFPRMRADMISLVAKKDSLICAFGARYMKIHREKHFINVVSRKMRELAKILIEMRKLDSSIKIFLDLLQPQHYDNIIRATKIVASYDEQNDYFKSPTFALNIGTSLKQCCNIGILYALKKKENFGNKQAAEAEADLKTLIHLIESNWQYDISSQAANDLNIKKWNKITIVPLASDLRLLHNFLINKAQDAATKLLSNENDQDAFNTLIDVTFCRVLILNRKRPGELQRMYLYQYESSINSSSNYEEFSEVISPTEKILMEKFKRIVIRGKRGRGVPVLFTKDVQEHIEILIRCRKHFIDIANPYLFAKSGKTSLCGYKTVKKYVSTSGVRNPQAITATKLRKHLATITQLFNMNENDMEQLATFMGHTTGVHRKSYRLPDDVYQTAKIAKLLILMEKGTAAEYKGKSLDEINLNLEENLLECDHIDDSDVNNFCRDEEDFNENLNNSKQTNMENQEFTKPLKKRKLIPWTKDEKDVVLKYFKDNITAKKAPRKKECEELITNEPLLKNKTWLKIKVFIQNQYTKKQ